MIVILKRCADEDCKTITAKEACPICGGSTTVLPLGLPYRSVSPIRDLRGVVVRYELAGGAR